MGKEHETWYDIVNTVTHAGIFLTLKCSFIKVEAGQFLSANSARIKTNWEVF